MLPAKYTELGSSKLLSFLELPSIHCPYTMDQKFLNFIDEKPLLCYISERVQPFPCYLGLRYFALSYSLSLNRFSSSHGLIIGFKLVVQNRLGALSSPLVTLFSNECKSFSNLFLFDICLLIEKEGSATSVSIGCFLYCCYCPKIINLGWGKGTYSNLTFHW
jgi:hypothetical protein